jgi:hypothetical protein
MPALAAGCPRTVPAFDAYHDAKCVCPLERLERRAGDSRCDVSEGDRLTDIRGQRESAALVEPSVPTPVLSPWAAQSNRDNRRAIRCRRSVKSLPH